jgi:PAS domain S-box-containing protein
MDRALRILMVEDSPDDAELMSYELRRAGLRVEIERVTNAAAMSAALDKGGWDLVISDYVVPGFGGVEALELFQRRNPGIPFIVVSGHIGEEIAVAAMKAGADDYVMKDRLPRLAPAVQRALHETELRNAHQRAMQALVAGEERFRQLAENVTAAFFLFENPTPASPGSLSYISPAYEKIWGFPRESLQWEGERLLGTIHPDDSARVLAQLGTVARGGYQGEFRIVRMDLGVRWISFRTFPVRNESGEVYRIAALAEDITDRKSTEEQLAANACQLQQTVAEMRLIQAELRGTNEALSKSRENLERAVGERTAELVTANRELQRQMLERRRLESELLEIAENERRRIGFDLHDDLGQKLMGVSLLLKAIENRLKHQHRAEAGEIGEAQTLLEQVISHTHDLARRFSSLDSHGGSLNSMMENLAASVRATFQIACRYRVVGRAPRLSGEVTRQLYKIAQESVSNAVKHGRATLVTIMLARRREDVVLRIKNNGAPLRLNGVSRNRLGLRIMNYRAHTIGGVLTIRPNGQSGTLVACAIPYPPKAAQLEVPSTTPPRTARGQPGTEDHSTACPAVARE